MHRRRHREPENIMPAPISYPNNIKWFFRVHLPGFWNSETWSFISFAVWFILCAFIVCPNTQNTLHICSAKLCAAYYGSYPKIYSRFGSLPAVSSIQGQLTAVALEFTGNWPEITSLTVSAQLFWMWLHCSHLPEHAAPKRERVLSSDSKQIKYWICYWHLYFILRETERHDLGI